MPNCAFKTCNNYSHNTNAKNKNVTFHRFPRDAQMKQKWINAIKRGRNWFPGPGTTVCSVHFEEHFIDSNKKRRYLLPEAVPTLKLNGGRDEDSIENCEEETRDISHQASNINVMLQNASNMQKIPLMDIEVVPSIDQATCDTETVNQQRSVISDIIKSIMHSLDLLIKSDADNVRSADVRNKIIMALFVYKDFVDDKDINMASYKEIDVLDDRNNLKEIDIVYNNNTEGFNITHDNDSDSIKDQTNLRKKKVIIVKRMIKKINAKRIITPSQKYKPVKVVNKRIVNEDNEMDIVYDSNITSKVDSVADCNTNYERDEFLSNTKVKKETLAKRIKEVEVSGRPSKKKKLVKDKTAVSKDGETENLDEIVIDPIKTEPIPRFVCADCDITVISEHHLTVHKDICKLKYNYYGNPLLEEYWSTRKCPLCDLSFQNLGNLRRHYVTHRVRDIETAFTPLRDKELCPGNAERNIKLFNYFIAQFEEIEKELGNETSCGSSNKPSITDYVKFNIKKIVYDTVPDKELLCLQCDILFNTKEELEEHKKKINSTDVFICNHCDATFGQPYKLIAHTKATHEGLYNPISLYLNSIPEDDVAEYCPRLIDYRLYVCKYCLLMFPQKVSLNSHLARYKMNGVCTKKSPDGSIAKRLPDGRFQCNKCEKSLPNCHLFMEHFATHSDKLNYYCECGKGFKIKARLRSHIRFVHAEKQQVVCELCGATMLSNKLKRHMKVYHENQQVVCEATMLSNNLKKHMKANRKIQQVTCDVCGATMLSNKMKKHMRTNHENHQVDCEVCGETMLYNKLNRHMHMHYLNQQVVCEVCGATVLYNNMKRHMNVHSDVKPYQCAYCNKRCKAKEALISHIRTHTGEKPWKCKYCGMAFSERRTYNIHINIHEGKTPYKCTQCPSAFVSKIKLNKHSLEHNDCRQDKLLSTSIVPY